MPPEVALPSTDAALPLLPSIENPYYFIASRVIYLAPSAREHEREGETLAGSVAFHL